ncbi:MAG: transglutaminase-like domain-containing protein [Candidatus Eremiobacterota bacterium]
MFTESGETIKVDLCRASVDRMCKVCFDYFYPEDNVKEILAEKFKNTSEEVRNSWIKERMESVTIDGMKYYSTKFLENLDYRYRDIKSSDPFDYEKNKKSFAILKNIIYSPNVNNYSIPSWQTYSNPVTYVGTHTIDIPEDKLPKKGTLKLWFPMPVLTGSQRDIKITSITPEEYVKTPPLIDSELGLVYMEIPLENRKGNLKCEIKFLFTSYEQNFIIDPNNTGEYDRENFLYRHYTSSGGNTIITPEIKEKALEITGDEKNPYKAAKKIYDYIVNNIKYSLMPHLSLNATGIAESTYIHKYGYGDCSTQSLYFVALCRSIGIPARTTGGYQMILGEEAPHFWAEFYLPDYGWVPVDTSIAQIAEELSENMPEITDDDIKAGKEYFFAHLDPCRFVIQKDLDITLTPPASDPVFCSMALQLPAIECKSVENIMEMQVILLGCYTLEIKPVNQ